MPRRSKKITRTSTHKITRLNDVQIARNFTTRRNRIYPARAQSFARFYQSKKEFRSENFRCSSLKLFIFFSRRVSHFTRIVTFFFFLSIPTSGKPLFSAALLLLHNARTDNTQTQTTTRRRTHLSLSLACFHLGCLLYTRTHALVNKSFFNLYIYRFFVSGKVLEKKPREKKHTHVYSGA